MPGSHEKPLGEHFGLLPVDVQVVFDRASLLQRGRSGRRPVPPDLLAAAVAWAEGFRAADKAGLSDSADPGVQLLLAQYAASAAKCENQAPRPVLDETLRAPTVLQFDVSALLQTTRAVLETGDREMCEVHQRTDVAPPLCPALLVALTHSRKVPKSWRIRDRKEHARCFLASTPCIEWLQAYRRMIADLVVPLLGPVAFQCPPTVRVHLPGRRIGHRHKDDDYPGHQGEEINFWLPLTRAQGTSSLFVESTPGRGDFAPLDVHPGECFRFHGGQCEHYTVVNETGVSRVSLDFRVIPLALWRNEFGDRIGDYPCEVAGE